MNTATMGAPRTRPTLLTVICILSFIWAGFSIIAGFIGYGVFKMMASGKMEEMMAQTGDTSAMGKFEEAQAKMAETGLSLDQLATSSLATVGMAIIALIGVILMWKLKRTGFYIYLVAQVIAYAMPVIMGGKLSMEWTTIVGMIFSSIFIILYAVNLKHMR